MGMSQYFVERELLAFLLTFSHFDLKVMKVGQIKIYDGVSRTARMFSSSWRASKHAGAPLSNAHWSLLKGKPTGLPLGTGNTRRKEGRGVWVKRRSDIIKRRTEVNMHAREGAYRLLLFTQQWQYFIRAGGVTHSYVRSELFFICCSEYACVGRCVAFLGRRVKLRTVQLYNASWKRLNATSCRTVTLSQCTYTQSDTAVNQTHSHTVRPVLQTLKEHALHAWNYWSGPMPRNQSQRAHNVSRSQR